MHEPVELVILDLDGTLIETETLVREVACAVCRAHGAELTDAAERAALGRRPLDAWAQVAAALGLAAPPAALLAASEPLLEARWGEAALLPGAARLVHHLRRAGVRLALATSTPRATYEKKLASKPDLAAAFGGLVVTGCDVANGKPHPEAFLRAAALAGVDAARCLAVEDAPAGAAAAAAAGMRVVVVPSMRGAEGYPTANPSAAAGCVAVLPSLLDFDPALYGLPPFGDRVGETVPLTGGAAGELAPWRLRGAVVAGFGRGSKQLGIPTANLEPAALRGALAGCVSGIFFGYASVGDCDAVYEMVCSLGWNPVWANRERSLEPWLLHEFSEGACFRGRQLRLVVVGYLRPEANFASLDALRARIHADAAAARAALALPPYAVARADPFLRPHAAG